MDIMNALVLETLPKLADVKPNLASVFQHQIKSRDRVLGGVENKSFIALPGKGGHSRLMPSKLCVQPGERGGL